MVNPERVTLVLLPAISNIRLFVLINCRAGPGPMIDKLRLMSNSPLVIQIEPGVGSAKVIVSPLAALAMAARKVPGPLSAVLVTAIVAARTAMAFAQTSVKPKKDARLVDVKCEGFT